VLNGSIADDSTISGPSRYCLSQLFPLSTPVCEQEIIP
jgi:hypothetical protein